MALNFAVCAIVWLRSEAVIERRYPLPSTTVAATTEVKTIARGTHLAAIAGCSDCHGADLEGRLMRAGSLLPVWSSNLRIAAHTLTDEEFERAIRTGILPDSKSTWVMPAMDYAYMSEDDVTAIVSYLRTLKALGATPPAPHFDMPARFAIARGDLEPIALTAPESPTSLDLGPRYDGGRYLARIACADCHDTDLTGSETAPDLSVVARYDRGQFFRLLKTGITPDGRRLESKMRPRFRAFHDYEVDALYDYLTARANALQRGVR
jgi:mono/diheme cytochrome c family protein